MLAKQCPELASPSESTFAAVLKRNGLVRPRRKRTKSTPYTAPLGHAQQPNAVWAIDFKGDFAIGRTRCYLPLERASAHVFFQLVTRRYERGSILLTTNQPVTEWGHVFGDEMIAAAVLDRLLHHAHTLVVHGESYRLKQQKKAGLLAGRKP